MVFVWLYPYPKFPIPNDPAIKVAYALTKAQCLISNSPLTIGESAVYATCCDFKRFYEAAPQQQMWLNSKSKNLFNYLFQNNINIVNNNMQHVF